MIRPRHLLPWIRARVRVLPIAEGHGTFARRRSTPSKPPRATDRELINLMAAKQMSSPSGYPYPEESDCLGALAREVTRLRSQHDNW